MNKYLLLYKKLTLLRSFSRTNCHRTKESKNGFASVVMNVRRQSVCSPIAFRSRTARGGKYSSQKLASANLGISASVIPRDCMICHWYLAVPALALALDFFPFDLSCEKGKLKNGIWANR